MAFPITGTTAKFDRIGESLGVFIGKWLLRVPVNPHVLPAHPQPRLRWPSRPLGCIDVRETSKRPLAGLGHAPSHALHTGLLLSCCRAVVRHLVVHSGWWARKLSWCTSLLVVACSMVVTCRSFVLARLAYLTGLFADVRACVFAAADFDSVGTRVKKGVESTKVCNPVDCNAFRVRFEAACLPASLRAGCSASTWCSRRQCVLHATTL